MQRAVVVGVDEDAGLGGTNSGGPPIGGRDDRALHRHCLERRLAERLDQRRLAEHVAGGDPGGTSSCGTRPTTRTSVAALELRRAAGRRRRTRAGRAERSNASARPRRSCARSASRRTGTRARRRPSRARARAGSASAGGTHRGRRRSRRSRSSAPPRGSDVGEPLGEPARVRDHGGRRRATTRAVAGADAADLARSCATSWPCAITTSGPRAASEAAAPAAPAGKRKWAKTTSGRRRRAVATASARGGRTSCGAPPRWLIAATSTSCPERLELAAAAGRGSCRDPGSPGSATSGSRAGSSSARPDPARVQPTSLLIVNVRSPRGVATTTSAPISASRRALPTSPRRAPSRPRSAGLPSNHRPRLQPQATRAGCRRRR